MLRQHRGPGTGRSRLTIGLPRERPATGTRPQQATADSGLRPCLIRRQEAALKPGTLARLESAHTHANEAARLLAKKGFPASTDASADTPSRLYVMGLVSRSAQHWGKPGTAVSRPSVPAGTKGTQAPAPSWAQDLEQRGTPARCTILVCHKLVRIMFPSSNTSELARECAWTNMECRVGLFVSEPANGAISARIRKRMIERQHNGGC